MIESFRRENEIEKERVDYLYIPEAGLSREAPEHYRFTANRDLEGAWDFAKKKWGEGGDLFQKMKTPGELESHMVEGGLGI